MRVDHRGEEVPLLARERLAVLGLGRLDRRTGRVGRDHVAIRDRVAPHRGHDGRAESIARVLDVTAHQPAVEAHALIEKVPLEAVAVVGTPNANFLGLVALVDGGLRSATCRATTRRQFVLWPANVSTILFNQSAGLARAFQLALAAQLATDLRHPANVFGCSCDASGARRALPRRGRRP